MADLPQNVPPYLHIEVYRGIGFHQTSMGYWIFDAIPPTGGA